MLGEKKIRILYVWLGRAFCGTLLYRMERGGSILLGKYYKYIRIIFVPVLNLMQAYSNVEISYSADIKGGILILHPAVGCVISGHAVIGKNLTLTGGNVIGVKPNTRPGELVIGDSCIMGANAVIIGPVRLGSKISVGASSCVIRDCLTNGATLVGVPAVMK